MFPLQPLPQGKGDKKVASLLELYQKLFDLTRREQKVIQENKYEKLGPILKEKQETIYLIDQQGEAKNHPDREKVLELMQGIKELGNSNLEILKEEIRVTGEKLEKLNMGWHTLQNYNNSFQKQPSIIDRRG